MMPVGAALFKTPALELPGDPAIVSITEGAGSVSIVFTPPASDGGAAIIDYTATSSPGGFTGTSATSPITVTGLTGGTTYTFTVKARNGVGPSAESHAFIRVTQFICAGSNWEYSPEAACAAGVAHLDDVNPASRPWTVVSVDNPNCNYHNAFGNGTAAISSQVVYEPVP